jgi:hypothetical protein
MKFLYFGSNIQKFTLLTALSIVILRVGKKIVKIILENLVFKSSTIVRFRESGEVRLYMHDVFSISYVLELQGLSSIIKINPYTATISDWDKYELDVINGQQDW